MCERKWIMTRWSITKQEVSEGWQDEGREENKKRTVYKGLTVLLVFDAWSWTLCVTYTHSRQVVYPWAEFQILALVPEHLLSPSGLCGHDLHMVHSELLGVDAGKQTQVLSKSSKST